MIELDEESIGPPGLNGNRSSDFSCPIGADVADSSNIAHVINLGRAMAASLGAIEALAQWKWQNRDDRSA